MSRLSSKRVRLEIGPHGVRAELTGGWLRRRTLAQATHPWDPPMAPCPASATGLAVRWEAAAEAIVAALSAQHDLRGAPLDVEVADAFIHFDVAAGPFGDHGRARLDAVARAYVAEMLGHADPQEVRWHLQGDERHLLICALPALVVEALRVSADLHGLRLRSLRPSFEIGWRRHRAELQAGPCLFARSADGHALAAFVRDGVVEAFNAGTSASLPVVAGAGAEAAGTALDAFVDRMLASLGIDAAGIVRFVASVADDAPEAVSARWTVHSIGQGAS